MDQNWNDDTKDFNKDNAFVINKSNGAINSIDQDYEWLERYIPYEGPHWFIRFKK